MNKERQAPTVSPSSSAPVREARARSKRAPLVAALMAAGTVLVLLGFLVFLAPLLARLGMVGHLWYVLLVALGLTAGILVFALNKSWASYSGQALGGRLELGGPVVVMFAMVVLGFWLVPAPASSFDVTVFLDATGGDRPSGVPFGRERVSLELGADRKTEPVDEKGIARFIGVASSLRGNEVAPVLESEWREPVDPGKKLKIGEQPVHLEVRVKALRFVGNIDDEQGQGIASAQVSVDGKTVTTDAQGHFELLVRADLPIPDRFVEVSATGFQSYRAAFSPGSNALRVQLIRMKTVPRP